MKRFVPIVGVAIAISVCALAQTPNGQNSQIEQEFIRLEQEKDRAHQQGDRTVFERLYAPDFVLINVRGEMSKRKDLIESYTSRGPIFKTYTSDEIAVRVFGDAAIVTGRRRFKYDKSKIGAEDSYQARYTNVYAKRQGNWQIVASQFTMIEK